jgi:hypothetical protein
VYFGLVVTEIVSDAHQPKPLSKLLCTNKWTTAMTNMEEPDEISDSDIGAVRHMPKYDSGSLSRAAVQRAVNDENFFSSSIKNSIVDSDLIHQNKIRLKPFLLSLLILLLGLQRLLHARITSLLLQVD